MTDHPLRVPTAPGEAKTAHIIHSDADHGTALAELDRLMEIDPKAGTPEADELELLALVIEAYEKERFPIGLPSPIEAIRFRMDQQGLRECDLVPFFGTALSASDVLGGRRPLTLKMIRALHDGLGISLDALIQPSDGD